ncbi:MAG TPA: sugar ABC transporter substrate-binding protein [Anaerolineae bacterium]|nr:sugar ABC transporter substrate-binding protein [Anaerolineae bacterium]
MRKSIILALLISLFLGGCSRSAKPTVSFMVFGGPEELAAYQSLVDAFHAAQSDVAVELRYVPDQAEYRRRLAADFSAGAAADVMLLNYRRFATFAGQGGLEPLSSYLDQSTVLEEGDFYTPVIDSFRFDGQLWCIPQNMSSLVVYYNQDLFDAAGLPYPSDDWTWGEFLAAAQRLTVDLDGDGRPDQYGAGIEPSLNRLAPFIWQAGGELVDDPQNPTRLALDSPEAQAALQWFVNLQTEHGVAPDAVAESAEGSESRFLNGTLAMYFNSRRGVPTYRTITDFVWDVAPLPRGAQAASVLHSDGYCMAASSKEKEAAWKFIEFANSAAGQELIAATGRTVPSLRAVAESPLFLEPSEAPASSRVFVDAMDTIRAVPVMANWPPIEDTASQDIEQAFYGRVSVAEAAAAAIERTRQFFTLGAQ